MRDLADKAVSTLREEGAVALSERVFGFSKKRFKRALGLGSTDASYRQRIVKDVLFVNGCTLPHPSRYRVDHQIEQLHFSGYSCDSVFYEHVTPELSKYYRCIIFFRCPHTETIEELIVAARARNKLVLFDVDDLVIDESYVREIPYVAALEGKERLHYMDGVVRNQRTMLLCDGCITTTEALAVELRRFVPNVFINRNVASERMAELSLAAKEQKTQTRSKQCVLGYFSGSITHNADFAMILPALCRLMDENPNVSLKVCGYLDTPRALKRFKRRIWSEPFHDWEQLPKLIASVDINLVPLEDRIFNAAKSENKWVEAALVGVPSVVSDVGAFNKMIQHGETGLLCKTVDDWFDALTQLVTSRPNRVQLGKAAHEHVIRNCVTAQTAHNLANFLATMLAPSALFVLPSLAVSGGVNVVLRHCDILHANGYDVTVLSMANDAVGNPLGQRQSQRLSVVSGVNTPVHAGFDRAIATLWSTVEFVTTYPKIGKRYYLVQNFETGFYGFGEEKRVLANLTYNAFTDLRYVSVSKWCCRWLMERFRKAAAYVPNGIDLNRFSQTDRSFNGRIRILIEGSSDDNYKNVDESFAITARLDPQLFEIWYLSYAGKPKNWYRLDRFLHKVPYSEVPNVYQSCHILLKSSKLESFSYPPLEMMATGGLVVAAPNDGNVEYLEHGSNCLLYEPGAIGQASDLIEKIVEDPDLRATLRQNGLNTAKTRSWTRFNGEILRAYGCETPEARSEASTETSGPGGMNARSVGEDAAEPAKLEAQPSRARV